MKLFKSAQANLSLFPGATPPPEWDWDWVQPAAPNEATINAVPAISRPTGLEDRLRPAARGGLVRGDRSDWGSTHPDHRPIGMCRRRMQPGHGLPETQTTPRPDWGDRRVVRAWCQEKPAPPVIASVPDREFPRQGPLTKTINFDGWATRPWGQAVGSLGQSTVGRPWVCWQELMPAVATSRVASPLRSC